MLRLTRTQTAIHQYPSIFLWLNLAVLGADEFQNMTGQRRVASNAAKSAPNRRTRLEA